MRLLRGLTLFFLPLCLAACVSMPVDPLAYQNAAISLTMHGQLDGMTFAAELEMPSVPPEGDTPIDRRDFTLVYTAPATLAGLTAARCDGQLTLSRGDLTLPMGEDALAALALPVQLFCIDCELGEAAVVEQNGTTLNRISVSDDEGSYILWLDAEGFPRRIEAAVGTRQIAVDLLPVPSENITEKGTTVDS